MGRVGVSDQGDVGLEWFGGGLDSLLGEFGFERVDVFAEGDGEGRLDRKCSTGILGNIIKKYGIFNRSMVDEVFEVAKCGKA